jgi:hypothetical protein
VRLSSVREWLISASDADTSLERGINVRCVCVCVCGEAHVPKDDGEAIAEEIAQAKRLRYVSTTTTRSLARQQREVGLTQGLNGLVREVAHAQTVELCVEPAQLLGLKRGARACDDAIRRDRSTTKSSYCETYAHVVDGHELGRDSSLVLGSRIREPTGTRTVHTYDAHAHNAVLLAHTYSQ